MTVARKGSSGPTRKLLLPPQPVVGLVLQVGDTEKFPQALGFQSLDPFFRVSKQGPCFTAVEEDGGDQRLVEDSKIN